eukprot:5928368-Heterocapsa_arctica.AAC.1
MEVFSELLGHKTVKNRDSGAKDQGSKPPGSVFGTFPDLLAICRIFAACPANSACYLLHLRPVHTISFTLCLVFAAFAACPFNLPRYLIHLWPLLTIPVAIYYTSGLSTPFRFVFTSGAACPHNSGHCLLQSRPLRTINYHQPHLQALLERSNGVNFGLVLNPNTYYLGR